MIVLLMDAIAGLNFLDVSIGFCRGVAMIQKCGSTISESEKLRYEIFFFSNFGLGEFIPTNVPYYFVVMHHHFR